MQLVTMHHGMTVMTIRYVGEEAASEKNTFVLRLKVRCFREGGQMVNDRGQLQ